MGKNNYGQLSDGSWSDRSKPVQVASDVHAVAAGYYHTLFIKTDSSIWAMGWNYKGQLGNGTTVTSNTAVRVTGAAKRVAAG